MVLKTNFCIFLVKPVFFLLQKLTHVKSIHKGTMQIYSGIQIDWALSISPLPLCRQANIQSKAIAQFWAPWRDGGRGVRAGLAEAINETSPYPLTLHWGLPFPHQGLVGQRDSTPRKTTSSAQLNWSDFSDFALKLISTKSIHLAPLRAWQSPTQRHWQKGDRH